MSQMIEVKTAELEGAALDWAVAKAEGLPVCVMSVADQMAQFQPGDFTDYEREQLWQIKKPKVRIAEEVSHHSKPCPSYSTDWSQGGLLIDEHRVLFGQDFGIFVATIPGLAPTHAAGKTHLIASCRAIVAAKLGDTVQVPAELVTP
ncbi:phage protein NinX family protein [Stutzerimonas stutzeri]|uniref:phage protein NinX family protein n=1 Tax=Stutzerimonas stutzeri TaxID=316 RepID=UPI0006986BF2|nr:phage protein NinX family protein [Stutzerimonas stutzeri]